MRAFMIVLGFLTASACGAPSLAAQLDGTAVPDCAPNDGSATRIELGIAPECNSTVVDETELAFLLWSKPLAAGADFDTQASRCNGDGKCVQSTAGTVHLDTVDDAHLTGHAQFTMNGVVETHTFSVVRCTPANPIRCG